MEININQIKVIIIDADYKFFRVRTDSQEIRISAERYEKIIYPLLKDLNLICDIRFMLMG